MNSHVSKEFKAKARLDLPYEPGTVFSRGFFYFGDDLLMVTGSKTDIITFSQKYLHDKIYLMTIHECLKYKSDNRNNLVSFHLPAVITDAGIGLIITKNSKNSPLIEGTQSFGKFNPNHYYRFMGTLDSNNTLTKVLVASFKRFPRTIPAIVREWVYEAYVTLNDKAEEVIEVASRFPTYLPTQEDLDDVENSFSDEEEIQKLFDSIIGA